MNEYDALTDIESAIDFIKNAKAAIAITTIDLKLSEFVKRELLGRNFSVGEIRAKAKTRI